MHMSQDKFQGQRMRDLRKKKGMTQSDVGDALSLGKSTISQYETGVNDPDTSTLRKIASLLGCTTDYLLGITDEPSKPSSRDKKDLKKLLEESEVMFDGVPLDDDDKRRVEDVLTGLFWEAKQMNKRKKKKDKEDK